MWLTLGLALVVLVAARRVAWGYPPPDPPATALHRGEIAFVAAASEALLPPGGAIPASGLEAGIPVWIDRYVAVLPGMVRTLIRMMFFLFEHATVLFAAPGAGGRRRFSSLDFDQRVVVLEGWSTSGIVLRRIAFTSLRALLTLGFFAHPPVLRQLGLAPLDIPTPIGEADLLYPPIGRPASAIAYTAADLTPPSDGTPLDPHGPLHPDYREMDL